MPIPSTPDDRDHAPGTAASFRGSPGDSSGAEHRPGKKREQRERTMARLVAIAKERFGAKGYAAVAAEEIVVAAGVTRGALYHHFESKEGLLRAVVEELQAEIAHRVLEAAMAEAVPWDQLRAGCKAFLRASLDPVVRQVVLLDAPAVLGWSEWREIDERHSVRLLRECLEGLSAGGEIQTLEIESVTYLLSGAMNEAALWIANSGNPALSLAHAEESLNALLNGLLNRRP